MNTELDSLAIWRETSKDDPLPPLPKSLGAMRLSSAEPERLYHPPIIIPLEKFIHMDLPARGSLLHPWLPQQGLAMIHAYRGIGKTQLALSIGYAVASAGKVMGWEAPQAAGVLYIDGEMPAPAMQERLTAILTGADKPLKAPFNIMTPDLQYPGKAPFNLVFPEDQDELELALADVKLIIVDNLATIARSGKTNDAESWLPVQEWALRQRAAGRSVLFIHHSGKSGAQRGTSAKEDILDTVIGLRRPADYEPSQGARFELHFEKSRGMTGKDCDPLECSMVIDPRGRAVWATKPLEESLLAQVIALHKDGLSLSEIGEEVGRHKSNVSRLLAKAKAEGLL